jgi:hypothetical protein
MRDSTVFIYYFREPAKGVPNALVSQCFILSHECGRIHYISMDYYC